MTRYIQTLTALVLLLGVAPLATPAASVALVTGTRSLSDPAERGYALRLSNRLSLWLDEMGVAHDRLDDDDVIAGRLIGYRSALFGYNPQPPPQEQRAALAFREKGGKLIICYGADPDWAAASRIS